MDAILKAPFPVDALLQARLGRALDAHRPRPHADGKTSDLQDAVIAATVTLRALGMTPEGALLTVKALVYDIARADSAPVLADYLLVSDDLMKDVVLWCVESYFGEIS